MRIYTSYFANLKKIPDEFTTIAICGKSPDWYTGLQYKRLAPSYSIWSEYNNSGDSERYTLRFNSEILSKLNIHETFQALENMSGGKDIVLLCYESPEKFCHRHLVAEWLIMNGYDCKEL